MKKMLQRIFVLLMAAVCTVVFLTGCGMSVDSYSKKKESEINESLKSPSHSIRKRVESAHKTVDVYSAYVSDMKVTVKPGRYVIFGDSDIERIEMSITTHWNGFVHKGGKTVIRVTVENVEGNLKTTHVKITETDALVNTDDPSLWIKATAAIVTILVL